MISEKVLQEKMIEKFNDATTRFSWTPQKLEGYEKCINDIIDIIEEMAIENRAKAKCKRDTKKFYNDLLTKGKTIELDRKGIESL